MRTIGRVSGDTQRISEPFLLIKQKTRNKPVCIMDENLFTFVDAPYISGVLSRIGYHQKISYVPHTWTL